jgi:hypothetical protein
METRVAVCSAIFAVLFSLISFLRLLGSLRHLPTQLTVAAGVFGVIVGAVAGVAVTRRRLRFLAENAEVRTITPRVLSTILFTVGGMFILLSFWVFFSILAIGSQLAVLDFMFPMLPALWASEAIMFLRWERKHRKLIFAEYGWAGRLYTSSKTD